MGGGRRREVRPDGLPRNCRRGEKGGGPLPSEFEFSDFAPDFHSVAGRQGPLGAALGRLYASWNGPRALEGCGIAPQSGFVEVAVGKLTTSFQSCSTSLAVAGLTVLLR